jgi:hypothetical protein
MPEYIHTYIHFYIDTQGRITWNMKSKYKYYYLFASLKICFNFTAHDQFTQIPVQTACWPIRMQVEGEEDCCVGGGGRGMKQEKGKLFDFCDLLLLCVCLT